jgi:hypothetical protein
MSRKVTSTIAARGGRHGPGQGVLPHCRVRDAEASLREVVGQDSPCLVVRVNYEQKRVIPLGLPGTPCRN